MARKKYRRQRRRKKNKFNIARYLKNRPILVVAAAVIIVAAIVIGAVSCSNKAKHQSPSASADAFKPAEALDETKWTTENGFMKYNDDAYTSTIGIDVSEWTQDIDWQKVKDAGIDFVIFRVGYRGYETGKFVIDTKLEEYMTGAEAAGLKMGAYFVTQAINEAEAIEEAELVLEHVSGHEMSMPLYIDCEANSGTTSRTDSLTMQNYTDNAKAFCKRVEEAGYKGGVYSNETWIKNNLDLEQLYDYDIWFAKYTSTPSTSHLFNMWQYSEEGSVSGIEYWVDMNVRVEKK